MDTPFLIFGHVKIKNEFLECIEFLKELVTSGMKWSNVSIETLNDAWCTFNKHYNGKKLTFQKFFSLALESPVKRITIKQLLDMNEGDGPDNLNPKRLQDTAEKAYPSKDRPRGKRDIESIKYHVNTKDSVSPIVLMKINNKITLLDGAHRLVAANIRKSHIAVIII